MKYLKKAFLRFGIAFLIYIGFSYALVYMLNKYNISIEERNFDFPSTLHLKNIKINHELYSANIDQVDFSWSWTSLCNGKIKSEYLAVTDAIFELKEESKLTHDSTPLNLPTIEIKEILFKNVQILSAGLADTLDIKFSGLNILNLSFDNTLKIDSLLNNKNQIFYSYFPTKDNYNKVNKPATSSGIDFTGIPEFSINVLEFDDCGFILNNPSQQHKISNLNIDLHGFKSSALLNLGINNFTLTYQDTLDMVLSMNEARINKETEGEITDLVFDFPGLHLDLPLIKFFTKDDLKIDLMTKSSTLNTSLINIFQPEFQLPLKRNIAIKLDGEISYSKEKVNFNKFIVSLPESKQTSFIIDGYSSLPGNKDSVKLKISEFHTSITDIDQIYELDATLNQNPIVLNSKLEGTYKNLKIEGLILLNKTRLNFQSKIDQTQSGIEVLFTLNSPFLDPSLIIPTIPSDYNSRNITLSGNTLLDSTLIPIQSKLSISSDSIFIKNKWYGHPEILVAQNRQRTSVLVESKEEQLKLFLETKDDLHNYQHLSYHGFLNSRMPDLTATIGEFYSSFNGDFIIKENASRVNLKLDTIQLITKNKTFFTNANLSLNKDHLNGIELEFKLDGLKKLHFEVSNDIFEWLELEDKWRENLPKASLNANLELDSILIHELTGLNAYINLEDLQLSTFGDSIISSFNISQMYYEEYAFDEVAAKINTTPFSPNGDIYITSLENPYSNLERLVLEVNTGNDGIFGLALSTWIPEIGNDFRIAFQLQNLEDNLILKLDESKPLAYGGETWKPLVNQGLTLSPKSQGNSGNITIANQQQKIVIKSVNSVYELKIDSLNLEPIFNMFNLDYDLGGLLNLDTKYATQKGHLNWSGNITDLAIDSLNFGTLNFHGLNQPDDFQFYALSSFEQSKIDLSVSKKKAPIDFKIDINEFDLLTFSKVFPSWPESMEVTGFLNASLEGTFGEKLNSSGKVIFENASFTMADYGIFTQVNDSVILDNTDFRFNNFRLADAYGNQFLVNGKYRLGDDSPIDLRLKSDRFRLLEKNDKNGDIQGKVDIATNLLVEGHPDELSISGYLNTLQNSNIFYKYKSSVSLDEREKIISFTSFEEVNDITPIKIMQREKPIDWNVDFNIGKTDIYILLYETTQDYIRMVAKGDLQLRKGIGDQPWIFGTLESTEGSVFYDAPMVSDLNLKIEKAAIRWEGEFDKPKIDFRGSEVFRISPGELNSGLGDKKERASVTVLAMVDNKSIEEFDLEFDLKSNNSEIASQLQKLPAGTRQTYAINLLLFGKVDPSSESGSSSYMQGLVAKLNEITRRNLKNSDLSFYLDSSNETELASDEQMNRFGYSFSQGLFNKKVRLSLGGNIDLGNHSPNHIQKFNPLGSVQVDYILSQKPYIAITGSRENTYTGAIDGQVDKASLGISYRKRFQNFFRIFKKKKEEK